MRSHEGISPTLVTIATLIERLGETRARAITGIDVEFDATQPALQRRFQAEEAGRKLLIGLICPSDPDVRSPGGQIKSLLDTLQALIWASTPASELYLNITTYYRHFDISYEQFCWLRDLSLDLVLQAYDDSATDISVTLGSTTTDIELCCQIQHPSFGSHAPKIHSNRKHVEDVRGTLTTQSLGSDSWQIKITVPLSMNYLALGST